jgi:hypothetical protein
MVKVTVFRSLIHWVPLLTRHRCGIFFLCLAILVLLLNMTQSRIGMATSRMHHLRLALRDNRVLCVLVHNRCQLQNYSLQKINLWRKTFSASAVKLLLLSLNVIALYGQITELELQAHHGHICLSEVFLDVPSSSTIYTDSRGLFITCYRLSYSILGFAAISSQN